MAVDPDKQRVTINYIADDGNTYCIVTSHNHATPFNVTSDDTKPNLPKRWKPRVIHGVQQSDGRDIHIAVVCPNKTDPKWIGTSNILNVDPYGSYEITGRTGEKRTQGAQPFDGSQNPQNELVTIRYLSDDGNHYVVTTSRRHAAAVQATAPQAGDKPYPKRWKLRHYGLISTDLTGSDQKATLVEPNPASAAWVADTAFSFDMGDLGQFATTGRIDERRSRGAPGYTP